MYIHQSSFELHLFHEVCNVTTNQTCTYKTILSFGSCLPQAVKKHGYSFQFYCLKITVYSDSFHFFFLEIADQKSMNYYIS